MKDGLYLSTYLEINALGNLYGLSNRHDLNMSLWKKQGDDIILVHYWEFERSSGGKEHRGAFYNLDHAKQVINQMLSEYSIKLDDIVEIWGTPYLDTVDFFADIEEYSDITYHSIFHLFSTIMSNTKLFQNETIIGLAVDGGPDAISDKYCCDKNLYAGCVSKKGQLDMFPISSPGMLWMIASNYYALKEGTLMALGTASKSRAYCIPETEPFYQLSSNASSLLNYFMNIVRIVNGLTAEDEGKLFSGFDPMFSEIENKCSMVMKEVEKMSIRMMELNIDKIMDEYNIEPSDTYLALSGGYVLNCLCNTYLVHKYKFKGLIAPPCVNDSGLSLGIALYEFYKKMGTYNFDLCNAYHGDEDYSLDELIQTGKYRNYIVSITEFQPNMVAQDIKKAPIVWFDGKAEIGPRALGHRSLLADPTNPEAKTRLNEIKQRQWWRPVAPVILEEDMSEWFKDVYPSPYMLNAFKIKADKLNRIPAVSHIDSSARVQTINTDSKEKLYEVLKAFKELTQVPILCNTSLNDRGEPIINRIEEAFNFALRKKIEIVYINGTRIQLHNHNQYLENKPLIRWMDLSTCDGEERSTLLEEYNPYHINQEVLGTYFTLSEMYARYDIQDKRNAKELKLIIKQLNNSFMI